MKSIVTNLFVRNSFLKQEVSDLENPISPQEYSQSLERPHFDKGGSMSIDVKCEGTSERFPGRNIDQCHYPAGQ
jgi:hypothetical protein